MGEIGQACTIALGLILGLDANLLRIVLLSLAVSLSAVVIASTIALPLGAALAIYRLRALGMLVVALNALMGLPPVVVGLVVYLLLSRSGPLGALGMLFTPGAMVAAQAILVAPIVTVLCWRAASDTWARHGDALLIDGASRARAIPSILAMSGPNLLIAILAGFGRAIAEVGAIIIVGGNISGVTRTMTTSIALETSKGNLPLALALGLILISLSIAVSMTGFLLTRRLSR